MNDNKHIENFILLGCTPKKGRSVEKTLQIDGHKSCVLAATMLILYSALMYFGFEMGFNRYELVKVLCTNVVAVILTPLTVIHVIHKSKLGFII
jgi:hypothetical protein